MRFHVAKCDLEAALQVVSPSIASSGADITTHYVFRLTGSKDEGFGVDVITCSGRVFSSCPLIVNVDDPGDKGTFTIEGKRLRAWLSSVKDAALTFALDGAEVIARAPKGKQTFQSLSPDKRFIWNETLTASKLTATIPADRLAAALGYSKLFASTKESDQPDLCICEIKPRVLAEDGTVERAGGILYSTDKKGVCLIRVEGLADSAMRVHGKDVPNILAFLGTFDGTDVEVLEHERMLILRRGDGAVFGESRFQAVFPGLAIGMDDVDHHQWILSKDDLTEGIGFLTSGAAWEDNRLHFTPGDSEGHVTLWMMSATGKKTELDLEYRRPVAEDMDALLTDPNEGGVVIPPAIPSEGFIVDHFCLAKVLNGHSDDVVFGINLMGDRGFLRFVAEPNNDKYVTILAWLR